MISWKKENPYPLYLQLANTIRQKIISGELKMNDMLPPENKFSEELGVCHLTLRKALGKLEKEAYINRIRGKGTFIADISKKQSNELLVTLFMENQGHVFEPMYNSLVGKLQSHNLFPILLNKQKGTDVYELSKYQIDYALGLNPKAIVVDRSESEFAYDYLKSKKGKVAHLIFMNQISEYFSFEADYVFKDDFYGVNSLTRRFLDAGHKKIVYLINEEIYRAVPKNRQPMTPQLSGYMSAMKDARLDGKCSLFYWTGDREGNRKKMMELLKGKDRPSAIIASQDSRAVWVMDIAKEIGLSIPEELAVAGYNNTPWCEKSDPPLTSVSIQEEAISQAVADRIFAGDGECRKIVIRPKLVIRESCGTKREDGK